MALSDMTVAELRDLANKTHVQLGTLTLKADIIEAIEAAGVSVDEPDEEPQAEVEGEGEYEEPEASMELEEPPDAQLEPEAEEPSEPVVKAGGYIATDKGWELAENVKG